MDPDFSGNTLGVWSSPDESLRMFLISSSQNALSLLTPDSAAGMGVNSCVPGLFAMIFPFRPETGTKLFARAFNAMNTAEALFYADSALVEAPERDLSLVVMVGAAQPLDPRDIDAGGLNNSWEKALGTDDRFSSDYDGDGINDLSEMLAGTDPVRLDLWFILCLVGGGRIGGCVSGRSPHPRPG